MLNFLLSLYLLPLLITVKYFTILRIEDAQKEVKVYGYDKLSYSKCLSLCCVPVVNLILCGVVVKALLK